MPQYWISIRTSFGPTSRRVKSNGSNLASGPFVANPCVAIAFVSAGFIWFSLYYLFDRRDYLHLDRDRSGKGIDLDRCSTWPVVGKVLGINSIVSCEVCLHICQEDGDVYDLVPRRAGILDYVTDILEYGPALRLDVV